MQTANSLKINELAVIFNVEAEPMRPFFLKIILPFYRRWGLWFIRRERVWRFEKLRLVVPPGVFHPGVFFSSPLFIGFLKTQPLAGRRVLDLGTGSGLLAIWSARAGAVVWAVDINPLAVGAASRNAAANSLKINALRSDLFDELPAAKPFDLILINPPFYPVSPKNEVEKAWFAGPAFEYFEKLFREMPPFLKPETGRCQMILSEDCDLAAILAIGEKHGFKTQKIWERTSWGERFEVVESKFTGR